MSLALFIEKNRLDVQVLHGEGQFFVEPDSRGLVFGVIHPVLGAPERVNNGLLRNDALEKLHAKVEDVIKAEAAQGRQVLFTEILQLSSTVRDGIIVA